MHATRYGLKRTLVVEGNPLQLARTFNAGEGYFALVTIDTCDDRVVRSEILSGSRSQSAKEVMLCVLEGTTHCFLVVRITDDFSINAIVRLALYRSNDTGFPVCLKAVSVLCLSIISQATSLTPGKTDTLRS